MERQWSLEGRMRLYRRGREVTELTKWRVIVSWSDGPVKKRGGKKKIYID